MEEAKYPAVVIGFVLACWTFLPAMAQDTSAWMTPPSEVFAQLSDEQTASGLPEEISERPVDSPSHASNLIHDKPISRLTIHAAPPAQTNGNGDMPEDAASARFAALPEAHDQSQRPWFEPAVMWRPSGELAHRPVYFEETNLERHGRAPRHLQPVISATRFVGTIVAMPYLMVADPPNVSRYHWDPYPAGRHAPRVRELPPFKPSAGAVEAGIVTGLILLVP